MLRISVGKPQEVSEPRGLAVVTLPGPVASRRWAGGHRLQNCSVFRELEGETQLTSGASEMAVSGEEKLTSPSSGLGSYCPRFAEEKTDGQSLSPTAFPVLPVARAMAPCHGALHPPRRVPKEGTLVRLASLVLLLAGPVCGSLGQTAGPQHTVGYGA